MKQRIAWLTLPLVFGVLVWSVKWRAEHPAPTKLDLELRALIAESSAVRVSHSDCSWEGTNTGLSKQELTPFLERFHVLSGLDAPSGMNASGNGIINISYSFDKPRPSGVMGAGVAIEVDSREGVMRTFVKGWNKNAYNLHPATTKRWLELLFNHPRLGPQLRARMRR